MFKSLRFGKPRNPGFGISRSFYLTVLAAKAPLPSIYTLVNPKGDRGAVEGFGVPLCSNACESLLHEPLSRGAYAVASKDRKTVLRCLVLSKEEAGFDPEVFASSSLAKEADSELVARVRATWSLIQLTFESHDAMVAPALNFLLGFALRSAELSDGVLADPIAGTYLLPHGVRLSPDPSRIDCRLHVAIHSRPEATGTRVYSMGLQKFGLPEYELSDVPGQLVGEASSLLCHVAQYALDGHDLRIGAIVSGFQICEGGRDRGLWDGIDCRELRPAKDGLERSLKAWEEPDTRI